MGFAVCCRENKMEEDKRGEEERWQGAAAGGNIWHLKPVLLQG